MLLVVLCTGIWAEKLAEFEWLSHSSPIYSCCENRYLLADKKSGQVKLFDLQTGRESACFGRIGEGPGEFLMMLRNVILDGDRVWADSVGRLTVMDLDGRLIRDIRHDNWERLIGRVGENLLVEYHSSNSDRTAMVRKGTLCDETFKPIKLLFESERKMDVTKWEIFHADVVISFDTGHVLVADPKKQGELSLLDSNGELIRTIRHKFEILPISAEDRRAMEKEKMDEFKKSSPQLAAQIKIIVPEHYPLLNRMFLDSSHILVSTFKKMNKNTEVLFFDFEGRNLGKKSFPDEALVYFHEGYFYYFKNNDETDLMELHRLSVGEPNP